VISTTTTALPDGPARCIACPSEAVRIVTVDGHQVWLGPEHERLIMPDAGVATGSAGRVIV
jgi:hypothetical protein